MKLHLRRNRILMTRNEWQEMKDFWKTVPLKIDFYALFNCFNSDNGNFAEFCGIFHNVTCFWTENVKCWGSFSNDLLPSWYNLYWYQTQQSMKTNIFLSHVWWRFKFSLCSGNFSWKRFCWYALCIKANHSPILIKNENEKIKKLCTYRNEKKETLQ